MGARLQRHAIDEGRATPVTNMNMPINPHPKVPTPQPSPLPTATTPLPSPLPTTTLPTTPLPSPEPTTSYVMTECQLQCYSAYPSSSSQSGCHWGCSYYTGETCKDLSSSYYTGNCIYCCRSTSYPSIEECESQCASQTENGLYHSYERAACDVGCGYADAVEDPNGLLVGDDSVKH